MRLIFLLSCLVSWKAHAGPQGIKIETPSSDNSPVLTQPQTPDQDLGVQENTLPNTAPSESEVLPSVQTQNAQIVSQTKIALTPQTQTTQGSSLLKASPAQANAVQTAGQNLPVGLPPKSKAWKKEKQGLNSLQTANPEDVEALQNELRKIFDREIATPSREPQTPTAQIQGKTENAFDRIYQAASVAASASIYDAPVLFQSALKTTNESVKKGEILHAIAAQFKRAIFQSAAKKARQALPQLLEETATAALNRRTSVFERGLKAFESWNGLLGSPQKPLILNWPETQSYLQNLKKSAPQESSSLLESNSSLRLEETPSRQFKALLPPFSLANLSLKLLPQSPAGNLALIFGGQKIFAPSLNLTWKAFYDLERNLAGKSLFAAALSAAKYSAQIWAHGLWNWFWRVVAMFRAPTRINFGNGIEFQTHTPAFKRILHFLDKNSNAPISGSSVVFLNLQPLTEPYFNFKRAPSVEDAENLAKAYQNLSGDSSGLQGLSAIAQSLKTAPAKSADPRILNYWTERIDASAIAFLFQALKRAAKNLKKPVFFADQGKNQDTGTILLVFHESENSRAVSLLKEAGFDDSLQSAWVYALKYPKPSEVQSDISLAEKTASGQIKSLPTKNLSQISKPIEDARINQAVLTYQGLKDQQALLNWWNQFALTPNATPMAIALSRKLWALRKKPGMSPHSLLSIFKALKQSLPSPAQKREFGAALQALTR